MTTFIRLAVVSLLSTFLFLGAEVRAALPWPEAAVQGLQLRLKTGLCPAPQEDPLGRDICAAYGLTAKTKGSRLTLSRTGVSELVLDHSGQLIRIERGDNEREFFVNRVKIDAGTAKTHAELKSLIESALRQQGARLQLFLETAHAASPNPGIPALIQRLIAETHQLGNCSLYLEFGQKCIEGMGKLIDEIKKAKRSELASAEEGAGDIFRRNSYLTRIGHLSTHLDELEKRLEKNVFPFMERYNTVRICADQADPPWKADYTRRDAESALKECRVRISRAKEMGGLPALTSDEFERRMSTIKDMIEGSWRSKSKMTPEMWGGQAPRAPDDGRQ